MSDKVNESAAAAKTSKDASGDKVTKKATKKGGSTKTRPLDRTLEEAQTIIGKNSKLADMNSGRQLRTRAVVPGQAAKKPAVKRPSSGKPKKEGASSPKRAKAAGGKKGKKGSKASGSAALDGAATAGEAAAVGVSA